MTIAPLSSVAVPGGFQTIHADCPWAFATRSDKGLGKSAQAHYACMTIREIAELPVCDLAAPDCALFMWATFPMLPHALWVMERWGWIYKTGGAWGKRSKLDTSWAFGTGYIFRGAAELLLVGTRGSPTWRSKRERNLWIEPVRQHSRKPEAVYEMIERTAAGPRLDLFPRETREGWIPWGFEVSKFDPQK